MKPFGATTEFNEERASDLMRAYREIVGRQIESGKADSRRVFREVSEMPSIRFWVSAERAANAISLMMRGRLPSKRKTKIAMFKEIYKRFMAIRDKYPGKPMLHIMEKVVVQPAPSFYITAAYARKIIFAERKRNKLCKLAEIKRRLHHLL